MRTYLLLSVLFMSVSCIAQKTDTALLQHFKFRTPNYRSVFLSGNAAGNFSAGAQNNTPYSFSFNPSLQANKLVSTDDELSNYNYEASLSFNHDKNELATGTQRNTNFTYSVKQSAQRKRYRETNYTITGLSAILNHSISAATNNYLKKDNNASTSVAYTIGAGKGRIENVTDAQMALYILNKLKKSNLLTGEFTLEDAYGLARTITQVNNTRLFDFRRKHIFELKQIDSFLNSKGLIKEKNIDYFTTVADNWLYAFNPNRRHGKERYITLTPTLGLNDRKTIYSLPADSSFNQFSKSATIFLTVGLEKATAVSLKRQRTAGINFQTVYSYGETKNTANTVVSKYSGNNVISYLNTFLHWGYYPGTRTVINTNLYNMLIWEYEKAQFSNNTNCSFSGNYFINYNTRLFADVMANVSMNRNANNDFSAVLSSSFRIGLQHYIR